jgi:hypothetical protein
MPYLPGQRFKCTTGEVCEDCDQPATWTVVGETDSFGSEYIHLCDTHLEAFNRTTKESDRSGHCDWCKQHSESLKPRRDIDEGSSGPVYYVCEPCIAKDVARINEELYGSDDVEDYECEDSGPEIYQITLTSKLPSGDWKHQHLVVKTGGGYELTHTRDDATPYQTESVAIEAAKQFIANSGDIDITDVEISVGCQYGTVLVHNQLD